MKDISAHDGALGVIETLGQMAKVLGFHDLTSFFITSIFLLCAIALVITGALFLVKKRRERAQEHIQQKEAIIIPEQVEDEPKAQFDVRADVKSELGAALKNTRGGFM